MATLFRGINHANLYSKFRPYPPSSLIDQIIKYANIKLTRPLQHALDIGCGSGQSTIIIAPYFHQVTGIDLSEAQIQQAREIRKASNVNYMISSAENLPLSDSSVDVVTACQSVHWLDLNKFFSEVKRILVSNGVLAVYGYWIPLPKLESPSKTNELTELIVENLHNDQLGKYWSEERYIVQNYYADIHLPFNDIIRNTKIVKKSTSSVDKYIGYISTWSAYQELLKRNPDKAQTLLEDVKNRIMKILDVKTTPEQTILDLETDYFLLMGRKI